MHRLANKRAEIITLDRGRGTTCTVNLHGATVTSWRLNYTEQLFVSKMAVFDNMWPIRGGIPIVFPQYGYDNVHMPNHGFARINKWNVRKNPEVLQNGDVEAEFFLDENPILAASYWQYKFELIFKVVLLEYGLKLNILVRNPSKSRYDYNVAFHAYIKVSNVESCEILGLKNCDYSDRVDLNTKNEKNEKVIVKEWIDRIYENTPNDIYLKNYREGTTMKFSKVNMPDVVIWNPWSTKAKELNRFGAEEYLKMICINPGYIAKSYLLNPGEEHESSLTLQKIENSLIRNDSSYE